MTNKQMLSVEREVVEGICNDFEAGRHFKACEGAAKLRALLDKPVLKSWPCWSCKTHITLAERAEADGECPHCEAELDLDDWPIETAAQHQGDPVAWYKPHWNGLSAEFFLGAKLVDAAFPEMWKKLYAEQPAPVADGTTSDKYKAELYDEVWQLARSMGFNNVTDALTGLVTPGESESECTSCDGSGEYTDAIGDWRGYCTCSAGVEAESLKGDKP